MIFTDGNRIASTNSLSELHSIYEEMVKDDPQLKDMQDKLKYFRGDHYALEQQSILISAIRHGAIFVSRENIDIIIKGGLPKPVPQAEIYFMSRDDFMEVMQVLQSCNPSNEKKDQVAKLLAKLGAWLEKSR